MLWRNILIKKFIKWSNNALYQNCDAEQTPIAFSHFTLENSEGNAVIVDIQGWKFENYYVFTDPQIHSHAHVQAGNLGENGILAFIHQHKCNPICELLKLKDITNIKFTKHPPKILSNESLTYYKRI